MGNKKKEMGTLIILHGWAYEIKKWGPFLKLLAQNGVEYKMLKIPGLTAPLGEVWTLDNYIEWLDKQVISYKSPVVLLGHSNGGRISIAYVLKYPKKVSKLILIDSAGIYHKGISLQIKRFTFGNLAKLKNFMNFSLIKTLFYKIVGEIDYKTASPIMKKVLQNLINSDLRSSINNVNIPTLIIWGEHDNTTPLSDGEQMNKRIKDSKLFVIKGAKHSPQFTNQEEVFEIIRQNL